VLLSASESESGEGVTVKLTGALAAGKFCPENVAPMVPVNWYCAFAGPKMLPSMTSVPGGVRGEHAEIPCVIARVRRRRCAA